MSARRAAREHLEKFRYFRGREGVPDNVGRVVDMELLFDALAEIEAEDIAEAQARAEASSASSSRRPAPER